MIVSESYPITDPAASIDLGRLSQRYAVPLGIVFAKLKMPKHPIELVRA